VAFSPENISRGLAPRRGLHIREAVFTCRTNGPDLHALDLLAVDDDPLGCLHLQNKAVALMMLPSMLHSAVFTCRTKVALR
jgi:hypothetical protein